MTRIAVFPGSFDPMTNAHLDVARRASRLFDRLVVGVLNNPKKAPLFPIEERVTLIQRCVADLENGRQAFAFASGLAAIGGREIVKEIVRVPKLVNLVTKR